jgi:A-factor biosynthesis hotdog domain
MVDLEHSIAKLRQWTAEFEQGPPPRLDRKVVHKHRVENVFVSRFERVGGEDSDHIVGQLYLDSAHPFFFEHALDHYPGLMLVEAGRQFGTAVAHAMYGVPLDAIFTLNGVTVEFNNFAELDVPVFVNSEVSEKQYKRGALVGMLYSGHFIQNEKPVGFMSGRWIMYSKKVMERMRRAAIKTVGGG